MPAPPRTIGIAGTGLIGTSIALAARRAWPQVRLSGVDRGGVLTHERVLAAFDRVSEDIDALSDADLVVLAPPVDVIVDLLPALRDRLAPDTVITDTGSTKRVIVGAAAGLRAFVGGHPMAGAERSGPDAARADLFDGRRWWVVPAENHATRVVRAFVEGLGATPMDVAADAHDALMAAVSHLPQVVASALMARVGQAVGEEGLAAAGAGLRDTTRLAASDGGMWASILATNADQVAPLLKALAGDLEQIAGRLERGESREAVERLFAVAARWRRQIE